MLQLQQIKANKKRLGENKLHYWLSGWASTNGALNLVTLTPCQQSTGTPEDTGILDWDQPCAEFLQTFMNRAIYANIFHLQ